MEKQMTIEFDVKGQSLGRAASEVVILLRGKDRPDFEPRIRPTRKVVISHVEELNIFPRKLDTKTYTRYSGYHSGLKATTLREFFKKSPKEVFKHAVWGMLPKNRSRKHIIKNLTFK